MDSKKLAVCVLEGSVKGTIRFEQEVRPPHTHTHTHTTPILCSSPVSTRKKVPREAGW